MQQDVRRPLDQLTKSLFTAGNQCHKLLWWRVHEPLAVELQPGVVLQDRFDQGNHVGALARDRFPGGVFMGFSGSERSGLSRDERERERIGRTRQAIDDGAMTIFEGSFFADNTSVMCDVLLREADGWRLIEVKATNSAKPEHHLDAAIQVHVLERCGIKVSAVEIMHLNKECRHPDLSDLFQRTLVTDDVRALLPHIHDEIVAQLAVIRGSLPERTIGLQCSEPYDCAFQERCWPDDPDHISNLYLVGRKKRGTTKGARSMRRFSCTSNAISSSDWRKAMTSGAMSS